jgi:transposase
MFMLGRKDQNDPGSFSNQNHLSSQSEENADLESYDSESRFRLRAVLLYEKGVSIEQVMAETGCSRSSLLNWHRAYKQHGVEGLVDRRQGGNNAKLTDEQMRDMGTRLCGRTPRDILGSRTATPDGQLWTVEDLYNIIWQWYGVKYKSRTSYYNLLKTCVPREQRSE